MAMLTGLYLSPNCFSWPAGTKKDGSHREAGTYKACYVYEDGPTPALSPVIEVQIPDALHTKFDEWQLTQKRLAPVKLYVDYAGKGKARLLDFA